MLLHYYKLDVVKYIITKRKNTEKSNVLLNSDHLELKYSGVCFNLLDPNWNIILM